MSSRRTKGREFTSPADGLSRTGLAGALRRLVPFAVLGVAPVLLVGILIVHDSSTFHPGPTGVYLDFRTFVRAGHDVLHGRSPYPPARSSVLAHEESFVYPAPAAIVMVPFALLPVRLAATLFALLLVAALPVALWILGVRDWRCYGLAILSGPLFSAITNAAISPLLAIPLAVMWRYRDRRWLAAIALACAVTLKLFLWPLLLWFAFTGRVRTALSAAALIAVGTIAAWAVIGFQGFLAYPHVLLLLSDLLDGKGYSLVALGRSTGVGTLLARLLPWLVGGAAMAVIAARGRKPGADRWSFALAVGAALALSPIVWLHYFVLLFVPVAIVSPRLAPIWWTPFLLWIIPGQSTQTLLWQSEHQPTDFALTPRVGDAWYIVYALVLVGTTLGLAIAAPARVTSGNSVVEPA